VRKYLKLQEGNLEEFEAEELEKFRAYIERLENEDTEENEVNPIVYEEMPFFTCDLGHLKRISFAVADDPFYKSLRSKYYPEAVIVNKAGKVLHTINCTSKSES